MAKFKLPKNLKKRTPQEVIDIIKKDPLIPAMVCRPVVMMIGKSQFAELGEYFWRAFVSLENGTAKRIGTRRCWRHLSPAMREACE